MSLNDSKIRNLKSPAKPVKLSDSHGLYLLVKPGGSRIWYLKYRFNGKESRVSLGAYPLVSLAEARQQRDVIRKLLAQNINPAQQRVAEKAASSPEKLFQAVALSWHKTNKKWSADYAERILASMSNHIFPAIGHLPVTVLKTQHFTALLKVIEDKGFLEVASRTRQQLCNIMRYAVQQGFIDNNPALHLEGVTAPPVKNHYPALPLERLLALTIDPTETDVLWLLDEKRLSETASTTQLVNVLRRADERQFTTLLSNSRINEYVVARLSNMAVDILERAALQDTLPIDAYVNVIQAVIPEVSNDRKLEIAKFALGRCLHNRFKDETIILPMLLGILGEKLDGRWIAHKGLERNIGIDIASRNMIALEKSPSTARRRIIEAVDEIAHMLQERRVIYLDEDANDACARLMFDAEDISYVALVDAAATLIPSLLHTHRQPISLMIAALFPIIYKELANLKNVPKRLNIFFFFDWDRCKAARIELVEAFMSSSWRPGDLALTACRCNDVSKILTQVAQSYSGEKYLAQIENDLDRLDESSKIYVQRVITECLYE